MQCLPRIGQEVLVAFLDGDIDQPLIVGALYNGQGEAGVGATPGAGEVAPALAAYAQAADFMPSAQGNLAGGNGPAWHGEGAGEAAHANAAALSGFKSQGFDGSGHNQWVFDDTDGQGRVQFASSQAATALNLGHLIHQADNYRGSFRGTGLELRTDAYGAVRGSRGVLFSTYALSSGEPAAEATAVGALLAQHAGQAKALHQATQEHGTVGLAGHAGVEAGASSRLEAQAAPLAALRRHAGARVAGADFGTATASGADDAVPHSTAALLTLAGRGGLGVLAGQSLHVAAEETLNLGSGQHGQYAVGRQLRLHAGQAIGLLAGAGGVDTVGLSLIAGQGVLEVQAQHDTLALRAREDLSVVSAHASALFAAKETIHLATAEGAYVTIEGGHITFGCPGRLTVHAASHRFEGPAHLSREMNQWDEAAFDERVRLTLRDGKTPASNYHYEYVRADGARLQGTTDDDGWATLQKGLGLEPLTLRLLGKAPGGA